MAVEDVSSNRFGTARSGAPCGPYVSLSKSGKPFLDYVGQRIFSAIRDFQAPGSLAKALTEMDERAIRRDLLSHMHHIDGAAFLAWTDYFDDLGATWCSIPEIRNIGQQGRWPTSPHLPGASSPDFWLRLRLLLDDATRCFSIYQNKSSEPENFRNLASYQTIGFQGYVDFETAQEIAQGALNHLTNFFLAQIPESIHFFLSGKDIDILTKSVQPDSFIQLNFEQAAQVLNAESKSTKAIDPKTGELELWDMIRLTQLTGKNVWLLDQPTELSYSQEPARTSDYSAKLLMAGYGPICTLECCSNRAEQLAQGVRQLGLNPSDFIAYMQNESFPFFRQTCGFRIGWERLFHWMLRLPTIEVATQLLV